MKRGLTPLALPLLGLGVLVCAGFFYSPSATYALDANVGKTPAAATTLAQCKANPKLADCVSFDPNVNPILIDQGYSYQTAGAGKVFTENGLQCVKYTGPLSSGYTPGTGCIKNGVFVLSSSVGGFSGDGAVPPVPTETTAQGTDVVQPPADSCGLNNLTACLVSGMAWIISEIEWLILGVAAGILGLANYLLGWSTYVTVFQFGNLVGNSAGLLAAWGVMRDVANIVLLFGFIFLGISTILNLPHSEYTAKKAIPSLIIFALLLNFSLFAVEAVIDVSNAFATSIYEQATGGAGVCDSNPDGVVGTVTNTLDCIFKQGIGGQVMAMSGMANMYGFGSGENEAASGGNVQMVVVYAGLIIFAVITTLVLFAAAIMLIIRAVVLAFLMVTAPIGFAGMAIPPLHEMASRWWKELLSQALFAPVYFLLALLSLKIMSGVMVALGTSSTGATRETLAGVFTAASDTGARGSNITIVMTFALIIGFMVAALMFAKKSSAMGTSMAMSGAGKLAFGSLGFVGRNTAGRVAYTAKTALKSTSFARGRTGSLVVKNLEKVGKASFDARATAPGRGLASLTGNIGTAQKGGYEAGVHSREEEQKKYAGTLKNTQAEKDRIEEIESEELPKAENDLKAANKGLEEAENRLKSVNTTLNSNIANNQKKVADTEAEIAQKVIERDAALASGDEELSTKLSNDITSAQAYADSLKIKIDTDKAEAVKNTQAATVLVNIAKGVKDISEKKVAGLKTEIKTTKNAPKADFADALHTPGILGKTVGRITGVSNVGDHHASEAIKFDLGKNESQKLIDALNGAKTAISSSSSGGGHADDTHAKDAGGGHGKDH